MFGSMNVARAMVMVTFGLLSSASCKHNDGSSPASPGSRTPDAGTTTHPNGIDDTKTGEPIGPVAGGLLGGVPTPESGDPAGVGVPDPINSPGIRVRAADGLGGMGGGPGLGGAPNGGVGAMGGLPPNGLRPTIGG
jgi:hypothetical protein